MEKINVIVSSIQTCSQISSLCRENIPSQIKISPLPLKNAMTLLYIVTIVLLLFANVLNIADFSVNVSH